MWSVFHIFRISFFRRRFAAAVFFYWGAERDEIAFLGSGECVCVCVHVHVVNVVNVVNDVLVGVLHVCCMCMFGVYVVRVSWQVMKCTILMMDKCACGDCFTSISDASRIVLFVYCIEDN